MHSHTRTAIRELEDQIKRVEGGKWVRRSPKAPGEVCLLYWANQFGYVDSLVNVANIAVGRAHRALHPRSRSMGPVFWNDDRAKNKGQVIRTLRKAIQILKESA